MLCNYGHDSSTHTTTTTLTPLDFTKSLCQIYIHKQHYRTNTHQLISLPLTTTAKVYRPITFIPKLNILNNYPTVHWTIKT